MLVARGTTVSLIVALVVIVASVATTTTDICQVPCGDEGIWKRRIDFNGKEVKKYIDKLKLNVAKLKTEVAKFNEQAELECSPPFKPVGGKTCLMLVQWESGTWEESRSVCRSLQSDLAVFLDRSAFYSALQFLSSYAQLPYHVWVGLQRNTPTSTWKWTTGDVFDLPLWAQDEPRDGTEKGNLLCHGVWKLNATTATETSYPLCQKKATNPLTDPQEPTSLNN